VAMRSLEATPARDSRSRAESPTLLPLWLWVALLALSGCSRCLEDETGGSAQPHAHPSGPIDYTQINQAARAHFPVQLRHFSDGGSGVVGLEPETPDDASPASPPAP
jgi:hypothetical protein